MNSIDGYTASYLADYAYFAERDGDDCWEVQIQAPGLPVFKVHHIGPVCGEPNSIVLANAQTGKLTRLIADEATMATFWRLSSICWALGTNEKREPEFMAPSQSEPQKIATVQSAMHVSPGRKKSITKITRRDRDFLKSLGIDPDLEVDNA